MSELAVSSNCLMLFLDETGHEEFADPSFPIFGIGGCAAMSQSYSDLIQQPWRKLKTEFFAGPNMPLHASDLHNISQDQINAIADFFRSNQFSRFFAVANSRTDIDKDLNPYQAVGICLVERIRRIASHYPFDSMAVIFEASERTDILCADFFSRFTFQVDGKDVPLEWRKMEKLPCEPGLEVADFIIHTSGAQLRDQLAGRFTGNKKFRQDFDCIFHSVDHRLSDGLLMESVTLKKGI